MSNYIEVDGAVLDVDGIYNVMDAGNKQHMANKLFKHGWAPQKAMKWLPDFLLEELEEIKRLESREFANEQNINPGDVIYLQDTIEEWHNTPYLVAKQAPRELRLINLHSGDYWSFDSTFGTSKTKFTFIPTNKEV